MGIEKYLYGVVPREMPDSWAEQALMAQAVAARTYALYVKEKSVHPDYDLEATTASQVYGGIRAESQRSTRAVNATRGQVMTHDGKLIVAYFHSDSGGHTEDPSNVWNTDTIPYLCGVPERLNQQPHVKNLGILPFLQGSGGAAEPVWSGHCPAVPDQSYESVKVRPFFNRPDLYGQRCHRIIEQSFPGLHRGDKAEKHPVSHVRPQRRDPVPGQRIWPWRWYEPMGCQKNGAIRVVLSRYLEILLQRH